MKMADSKRVLVVLCVIAVLLSASNLYLIQENTRLLQEQLSTVQRDYSADDSIYAYVIFKDGDIYKAKNQTTGLVIYSSADAGVVISQAVANGTLVYIKNGTYTLTTSVQVTNQSNVRIVSDGATINGNGYNITVKGDDYTLSKFNLIAGLRIVNATVRIENSFGTTVADMIFENCGTALEIANTETWSEGTKIDNIHFSNVTEGIAFRTPTGNATGSYASTEISRCFFNIYDNAVGINVERDAEYSDSQLFNSRLWMGENGYETNQTGLRLDGSMFQTLISSVVFESFAATPSELYAVVFDVNAETPPIFDAGISFLGNWSARIRNLSNKWVSGQGSIFKKENIDIPIGADGEYGAAVDIHARPVTISTFKPRIRVQGSFAEGETVTVRFRLELLDNTIVGNVEKTFTGSSSLWLDDDDLLALFPSQNVIWSILVDAKSTAATTGVTVKVDVYGAAT
jgi:hypothetical protein